MGVIICPKCGGDETYFNDYISGWFVYWTHGDNTELLDDPRLKWRDSKTCHCNVCKHSWHVEERYD